MNSIGARLRAYREKAGLQPEGLADSIGVTPLWYEDLENNEGDLEDSLDLEQIRKLALQLRVGMAQLLTGAPVPPGTRPLDFREVARLLRRRLEDVPGLEALEEKSGWDLGAFLKRPDTEGWGQRAPFFRDLGKALGFDWLGVLAYCESLRDLEE